MSQEFAIFVRQLALAVRDEPEIHNRHIIRQYLRPPLETIWEGQLVELEIVSDFDQMLGLMTTTTSGAPTEEKYVHVDDKLHNDSPLSLGRPSSDFTPCAPSLADYSPLSDLSINPPVSPTQPSAPAFLISTERPVFEIFVDQTDPTSKDRIPILPKPQYKVAKNMAQRQLKVTTKTNDKGLKESSTNNTVLRRVTAHDENSLQGRDSSLRCKSAVPEPQTQQQRLAEMQQ